MECDVIGSGSRCDRYTSKKFISICCNIPRFNADYVYVYDYRVVGVIKANDNYKLVVSDELYNRLIAEKSTLVKRIHAVTSDKNRLLETSSGHCAAEFMITIGFTRLNLYGIDSWFDTSNWMNSYTDKFVDKPSDMKVDTGMQWKSRWNTMIKQHPNVTFRFI